MGWAIFTYANPVVGEHIDHAQPHEGRKTHTATHVVAKDQECAAIGDHAAVEGHAVEDTRHGMFAYAKVHVAATKAIGQNIAYAVHVGFIAAGKIGATAH